MKGTPPFMPAAASRSLVKTVAAEPGGRSQVRTQRADRVIALLLTLVGAWVIWTGVQLVRAEARAMQARSRIDAWVSGGAAWRLPEWLEARGALEAAATITPSNATLHDYLAVLHMLRGRHAWLDETLRHAFYGEARTHQLRSLALRPSHGTGWANLGQIEHALAPCSDAQWSAWRKALYFAPYEPPVQMVLADLSLACFSRHPPEVRAWLQSHCAQASGKVRTHLLAALKRQGREVQDALASLVPPNN